MAGDWLKIENGLPEKPEVWEMAMTLGVEPDLVVGKLIKVWRWFDQHTESGNAYSVTYALLDSVAGLVGFAEAMSFAGWLVVKGKDTILPNFERHNGKTSKNRALTAKRVAAHKAKSGNAEVTITALPREEKRRDKEQDQNQKKELTDLANLPVRDGQTFQLTDELITSYRTAFPGIDLKAELAKMRSWLTSNPGRVKTSRGMPRFIHSWLQRAQADGRTAQLSIDQSPAQANRL